MLADVLPYLRCPHDAAALTGAGHALGCPDRHSFDIARQGYVNLLTGRPPAGADTVDMVQARADFLAAGHFDALTATISTAAVTENAIAGTGNDAGLVVEVGAGTGHYLAAVLQRRGGVGLALDVAKPAARRAARAHPRIGAAVCDIWRGLPVADGCAAVLLDVFAPRNPAEFHRVLRPDGTLVVATPEPEHLAELVRGLGLLGVDPAKPARLDARLGPWFDLVEQERYDHEVSLSHPDAARLAAMGPSAFHLTRAELAERVDKLPEPTAVRLAVRIAVYRPR